MKKARERELSSLISNTDSPVTHPESAAGEDSSQVETPLDSGLTMDFSPLHLILHSPDATANEAVASMKLDRIKLLGSTEKNSSLLVSG